MPDDIVRTKVVDKPVVALSLTTLAKSFHEPQHQAVKVAALVLEDFQRSLAFAAEDIAWMLQDGIPVPIIAQDSKFLIQAAHRVGQTLDDLRAVDQLTGLLFGAPDPTTPEGIEKRILDDAIAVAKAVSTHVGPLHVTHDMKRVIELAPAVNTLLIDLIVWLNDTPFAENFAASLQETVAWIAKAELIIGETAVKISEKTGVPTLAMKALADNAIKTAKAKVGAPSMPAKTAPIDIEKPQHHGKIGKPKSVAKTGEGFEDAGLEVDDAGEIDADSILIDPAAFGYTIQDRVVLKSGFVQVTGSGRVFHESFGQSEFVEMIRKALESDHDLPIAKSLGDEASLPVYNLVLERVAEPRVETAKVIKTSSIQTLILSKLRFPTMADAIAWVQEHKFMAQLDGKKPQETEDGFRFIQQDPNDFEGEFRTVEITDGVQAVIATPKSALPMLKSVETTSVTKSIVATIAKINVEKREVTGIVLEPNVTDGQGDIYSAETIAKAMETFMTRLAKSEAELGVQHSDFTKNLKVLESWIVKEASSMGGTLLKAGTWMATVKVLDDDTWESVKNGDLTGFSIGGTALAKEVAA